MDLERVQYRGFQPRQEVTDHAEEMIQQILDGTKVNGIARVVIQDDGAKFHVSVVGKIEDKKLFSSEISFVKKNIWGWPRDWQLGAIFQVLGDLMRQVRGHFKDNEY